MPTRHPWPSPAQSTETRHIYRHLLREISYLPPAFSSSISSYVRRRFHDNKYPSLHDETRLSRAKRTLRTIKLANNGDGPRMLKLMHKGFGRSGPKRWQLLDRLGIAEGPADSEALEASTGGKPAPKAPVHVVKEKKPQQRLWPGQKVPSEAEKNAAKARRADIQAKAAPDPENPHRSHKWLEGLDRKELTAFLITQKRQQEYLKQRGAKVSWDGQITGTSETATVPEETIWGKPPKQVLVRTKVANWWRMQQRKMLPPLGKGDFELLGKLASGAQEQGDWKLPKQRTPAKSAQGQSETERWNWEASATQKTQVSEPSKFVNASKRLGWRISPFTGQTPRDSLSERWFRRQYQQILLKSSHAEENPNTLRKKYTWGTQPAYNVQPAAHQMFLFETPHKARPALVYLYKQPRISPLYSRFLDI